MKKTIAILLVLVVGTVSVFADNSTKLKLTTEVEPINKMVILNLDFEGTIDWDDYDNGAYSVYNEDAYGDITDATHYEQAGKIATLHARSNSRSGFSITMKASPLASTVGEGDDAISEYINYTVTVDGESSSSVDGADGDTATIATLGYDDLLITHSDDIYLKLDEKLSDAASGIYNGYITFTYVGP